MEHIHLDGREIFKDENSRHIYLNSNLKLEEEEGQSSEFKMESKKISSEVPSILNVKREDNSERCSRRSCPCSNKLTFPNYISFVSPNKNPSGHCIDLAELRTSNPLKTFSRTTSLFNIPLNLKSAEFPSERLKFRRRTRSINNLDDFFLECASAVESGDVIVSSSGQWYFTSMEGMIKARDLLKSSLFFQLGFVNGRKDQFRSRIASLRQIKSSELATPSGLPNSLLQKPRAKLITSGKHRSLSNISEGMLLSSSSTNSNSSYQSTSHANYSFSKGLLYCEWNSGIPNFIFSMGDDHSKVYLATPTKIESSVDKALDYMYMFHSRIDRKKDSRNHRDDAKSFVGKMKVSNSLVLSPNKSKFRETEFVLFGAHEDHSREMQSSSSTLRKCKGLPKKVAKIFQSSHSFKHNSFQKIGDGNYNFEGFTRERFVDELSHLHVSDHARYLKHDFPPNLELAAIVVRDYLYGSDKGAVAGGWGLKFLERVDVNNADTSQGPSCSSKSCREDWRESARRMNVIVPAGFHGGPITRSGGPSSLTERWRSGGHCDCGGWDIGCPLTILSNNIVHSKSLPQGESEAESKSVSLYAEGVDYGEPALRMENTSGEGLYLVYLRSTLSAVQSFSIAVAIIHSRTPALHPEM